ncbi:MAG: LacI family transcriptional regulator [Candidatus Caldatribacterium sp.]|uniref:LacI family DNA-binding transcriptional regulator n=1 Tax=Candidatus Caldatribacterium sp. TaxID=2282143 RepID=UPI0037F03F04|nr:LacI family transcriptional regulator [Candidatus Caldatribacterium sp.]MCX7730589.1 LacI family transcriptional regulator [Candidatus Caldatribacterium sp.]
MSENRKRPTIRDVAKLAGVSPSTVSHVLNKTRPVLPETEKKVLEAIKAISYRKNPIASALRTQRLHVVGFIVSQLHNIFWLRIIRSIEFHLSQQGYHLFLGCSYGEPSRELELIETMRQSGVEGIIIATTAHTFDEHSVPPVMRDEFLRFLTERVVFIDTAPSNGNFDFVGVNNEETAYRLTNMLIEKGHTTIGMINGKPTMLTARERAAGFWRAIREWGLQVREEHVFLGEGMGKKVGVEGAKQLLGSGAPPEAVFLASGNITVGFLEVVHEKGLHIPEDISIVGFDDIEWTPVTEPFLTCAVQPAWDIGEEAVNLLLEKLNNKPKRVPREVRLKCELLIRSSIAPKTGQGGKSNGLDKISSGSP